MGQKTQYILNRRARVNKAAIGHAAAKMMKKSITRRNRMDKKIEEKEGLMVNIEDIPKLTMNFQANYHSTLLETRGLGLKVGDKHLFSNLNLIVKNHGIVALEGKNGSGKSTFLKFLLNKVSANSNGRCVLANGLRISYLPQDFTIYQGFKEFCASSKIIL